jgi:hypothetical protein
MHDRGLILAIARAAGLSTNHLIGGKTGAFLINRKGMKLAGDMHHGMFEVVITKRKPMKWEWQVCNRDGITVMRGWEHTRHAAKYRGDRALFLLLAAAAYDPSKRRWGPQGSR